MDKEERLARIVLKYREELQKRIKDRELEMQGDDTRHYLVYHALGFTSEEGYQIDYHQNVGRFLYKYAGSMLEELAIRCFQLAYPDAQPKVKLQNTVDSSPKTVEIDCLVGTKAYEIKWNQMEGCNHRRGSCEERTEACENCGKSRVYSRQDYVF